jgi:hypothetical protein
MGNRFLPCATFVAALSLGWTGPAAPVAKQAATVLQLDTAALVERAAVILAGRVRSAQPVERADGSLDTEFELDVERTWLGDGEPSGRFRWPGGLRSDGSGLLLPGLPRLEVGEEVLLFLTSAESQRRLPVGLGQGRYALLTDRQGVRRAVRDASSLHLLGSGGPAAVRGVESLPFAQLAAEIEAALAARAGAPR